MPRQPNDPYAAPPRHRDRSGALVRLVVIAGLLGAAAWGYREYTTAALQSQTMAEAGHDSAPPAETPANLAPASSPSADAPAAADQPPA